MIKLTLFSKTLLLLVALQLSACGLLPEVEQGPRKAQTLRIFPDGSMQLMGRRIPDEDVIIYADGLGGEKAAVKISMEPLHPAFYRGAINVERLEKGPVANQ